MNSKAQRIITEYQSAIVSFSGFVAVSIVFLSGIGRYRVIAVYAAYCLFNSILSTYKPGKTIEYILLPATIIGLYLDATDGPFFPLFEKNYLLLAVPVAILLDTLARNSVEKALAKHNKNLFIVCPSCSYQNQTLVGNCGQCSYSAGGALVVSSPKIQAGIYSISSKVLRMLNLEEGEKILYYLSGFPSLTCFIKGDREVIIKFFVTDRQIIFLDYYRFNIRFVDSWRVKYTVPLSEVSRVVVKMKKMTITGIPCLEIITSAGETYELVFTNFGEKKNEIKEVANIIAKGNAKVAVEVNLPEASA